MRRHLCQPLLACQDSPMSIRMLLGVIGIAIATTGCAHKTKMIGASDIDVPRELSSIAVTGAMHSESSGVTLTSDYRKNADRHLRPIYEESPFEAYCGCEVDFDTKEIDLSECGYVSRNPRNSSNTKMQWEHVFPKSWVAQAMGCSSVAQCKSSPTKERAYIEAETDLHNLVPSVGSLNGMRSSNWLWEIDGEEREFGQCDFEVSRIDGETVIEPPDDHKGNLARIILYYAERYGLELPDSAIELYLEWNEIDPVDDEELARSLEIESIIGYPNRYVVEEQ